MNIGFIGLGLMGRPMAINIARGGHTLHIWARRAAALEPFAQLGAHAHVSAAEVAKHADLLFMCVADAPDVETVLPAPSAMVRWSAPGTCRRKSSSSDLRRSPLSGWFASSVIADEDRWAKSASWRSWLSIACATSLLTARASLRN